MKILNPFADKPLRSFYDPNAGGYWFSVVDLCDVIIGRGHKAARNYWKWMKNKYINEPTQVVSDTNHLKWQAPDGKYHFTEAVDFKTLVSLIQICPSPKANPYRMWIVDALFEGITARELEEQLAKLGKKSAEQVVERYKNNPNDQYVRMTVSREQIR